MIYRVLHELSFPKIGVQEKDVKWNKIINDNKHRKLHDKTLNKDYMMTSFGGTWYEGDDVVSNVIFHVSNISLFVPYIWLYYAGNGQVKWIFIYIFF